MSKIFEQLKSASQSEGEKPPIEALPAARKKGALGWLPAAFFAFAAVFMFVLYSTEHALRLEAEKAVSSAKSELDNAQADLKSLEKEKSDAEQNLNAQTEELNQKIQTLEKALAALEKERDGYKEESWNAQKETEGLKQDVAALTEEKKKLEAKILATKTSSEPAISKTEIPATQA